MRHMPRNASSEAEDTAALCPHCKRWILKPGEDESVLTEVSSCEHLLCIYDAKSCDFLSEPNAHREDILEVFDESVSNLDSDLSLIIGKKVTTVEYAQPGSSGPRGEGEVQYTVAFIG